MTRLFTGLALAIMIGGAAVSAQMKHVTLKDAKGADVGMAMISPAKGGGVSIDLDLHGLPRANTPCTSTRQRSVKAPTSRARPATSTRP